MVMAVLVAFELLEVGLEVLTVYRPPRPKEREAIVATLGGGAQVEWEQKWTIFVVPDTPYTYADYLGKPQ